MEQIHAKKALLQTGWADGVRLSVTGGRIAGVDTDAVAEPGDTRVGIVIPGLCNAHSHAFQRALVGQTEQRAAGHDSFWTWRERMYALAAHMDPDRLCAIATQAYSEMLESGYTAVAEFHYLHRVPGGKKSDGDMFGALHRATESSGIRITYVPVLYERAGFDDPRPQGVQSLFALGVDEFLQHHKDVAGRLSLRMNLGIGAHSLRAVSDASLRKIVDAAIDTDSPMHIHIAEQQREVDQCTSAYGRRPVRWLLENFDVGENWCLVHATHMDPEETAALARSGAVVCLCPSTEANLGDGLFALVDFLREGGTIAIGSDSHVSINPFEELRWLEYGQRLASRSRIIASLHDSHVGRELFERVLAGGALASGQRQAGLRVGSNADLVALDDDDPMLVANDDASVLDALVFSGYRLPIDRVMVAGTWCVVDGDHVHADRHRQAFANALRALRSER